DALFAVVALDPNAAARLQSLEHVLRTLAVRVADLRELLLAGVVRRLELLQHRLLLLGQLHLVVGDRWGRATSRRDVTRGRRAVQIADGLRRPGALGDDALAGDAEG